MDIGKKINFIKHNLAIEAYTIVAKESVGLIEHALRQLFSEHLTQLDEKDRLKVQKAELDIGKGEKGIESFTMGQLVGVFRTSRFLDAWARASGKDLSGVRVINFDELTKLRNKLIHGNQEAPYAEAELLFDCLQVILETFDIVSPEDAEKAFAVEVGHEVVVADSVFGKEHVEDVIALPQQVEAPIKGWRDNVVFFPRKLSSYKSLFLATALGLFIFLIFFLPHLHLVELKTLDWKFKTKQLYKAYQSQGEITIGKEHIIIIALRDDFLEGDTISQEKLASLIRRLSENHPKVMGLDVLLDKNKRGYEDLVKAIHTADNVIIPFDLEAQNLGQILEEFTQVHEKIGFANFHEDIDGVVRRLPLEQKYDMYIYYPFALQILRYFHDGRRIEEILGGHPEDKKSLRINFDKTEEQFIILQPEDIEKEAFKNLYYEDKIVLIGYLGDKQQGDEFLTPLSVGRQKIKGVLVQANIVNTIYLKQHIRSWIVLDFVIILFFASIGGYLLPGFGWMAKLLILPLTWVCYILLTLCLFMFMRVDIPLWSPMITLTLTVFLTLRKSR